MNTQRKKPDTSLLRFGKHRYSFGQIKKTVPKNWNGFLVSSGIKFITSFGAIQMAKKLIIDPYKEHFIAIYLSPVKKKAKCELISLGTLTTSIVHPREVFRPAIKYNSTEIIILHNHPSGDISPSEADIEITKRLKKAGQLLGIEVLDHVIFKNGNGFYSFNDKKK